MLDEVSWALDILCIWDILEHNQNLLIYTFQSTLFERIMILCLLLLDLFLFMILHYRIPKPFVQFGFKRYFLVTKSWYLLLNISCISRRNINHGFYYKHQWVCCSKSEPTYLLLHLSWGNMSNIFIVDSAFVIIPELACQGWSPEACLYWR